MSDNLALFGALIDAFELKEALARIKPAIASKGALPVLRGVHVSIRTPGEIVLTTTDLDLTLQTTIAGDLTGVGECIVPFAPLEKAVAGYTKNKTETIPFESGEGELTVTVQGADIRLNTLPTDEWPTLKPFEAAETLSFDIDAFCSLARYASSDGARPILTGILMADDGAYAATDSYRLATVTTDEVRTQAAPRLIPAYLAKILGKHGSGRVDAEFNQADGARYNGGDILITLDQLTVRSRTIEGDFPNYKGLIPSETPVAILADIGALRNAVEKVNKLKAALSANVEPIRLSTVYADSDESGEPKGIRVSITVQDTGTVEEVIPGMIQGGHNLGFNPDYMVSVLDGAEGQLCGVDALKPWIISWQADFGYCQRLLMPVRIS